MMKYIRHLILAIGFSLVMFPVKGQLLSLSTGSIQNLPDTVSYGDTIKNWSVWIKNSGALPVSGLWLDVEGTLGNLPGISTLGGDSIPLNLPLAPGDSIEIPLDYFVVSPSNSNTGSNVVVVWPAAPGVTPEDSTEDDYYVDDTPTGIAAPMDAAADLSVYPNPASDFLTLETAIPLQPERIRIYDLQGVLVLEADGKATRLQLSSLPQGTYLLQLLAEGHPPLVTRFIKN